MNVIPEKTEVKHGIESATSTIVQFLARAASRMDICADSSWPSVAMGVPVFKDAMIGLEKRNVQCRFLTDFTRDNLAFCKQLMEIAEVRHLDVRGNFAVSEAEYIASSTMKEQQLLPQVIYSNSEQIVEQQQYIFETLWNEAVPAERKVREIEEGVKPERTEVVNGVEETTNAILQVVDNSKSRMDGCGDQKAPMRIASFQPYKKTLLDARDRGVKIRIITDITKDNIQYCKELFKLANECRHLEGIKINNGISDSEYVASVISEQADVPYPQVIYSNSREVVGEQGYVFEALWSKAIPAEQRIKEIEEGVVRPETRVLDRPDDILAAMTSLNERSRMMSICAGPGALQFTRDFLFQVTSDMLSRHKKGAHGGVRYVTIVNRENAEVAKAFLELGMQIRHVKSMPPMSFGVSDREIGVTIEKVEGGRMVPSLLISNDQLYAQHFQAIFDELWKKGIDAIERINEIEDGIEAADIEVIRNPRESLERAWKMARSPKGEVLLMFSTTRAFQRQLRMGGLAVLQGAVRGRAKIRILLPADEESRIVIAQIGKALPEVEIRVMDKSLQTRITMLVVDKKECMLFELKDDSKRDSHEAVGVSMYSNSKTIGLSYASIFDSLWKQTELYEQLAAANEQLKVHDKMQKEFINIAAHELRTPIQPILAMSEMLEDELGDKREDIRMIARNARRLEQLTRNILDASKIESQSLRLDVKRISLNDVILNTLEDHGDRIAASNGSVRLLYQPVDIFIEADMERVTQVISNILGNALKFTASGEISIAAQKSEDDVVVSIRDTGSGIDPEIMPRLFSRFATKSDKGTGLGLFISKSIVEAHGGRIWAENNPDGKGATFTFRLPSVQRR